MIRLLNVKLNFKIDLPFTSDNIKASLKKRIIALCLYFGDDANQNLVKRKKASSGQVNRSTECFCCSF